MSRDQTKELLKAWGWIIPTVMIPMTLLAAKALADDHYIQIKNFNSHISNQSQHNTYEKNSKTFVPRTEIERTLRILQESVWRIDSKVDRMVELQRPYLNGTRD